jgi:hypothetical protein
MSMNLMELLLQVDARLRQLVGADESALQAVLDEVAAGPRPAGVAPDVEPRAVLAGLLVNIEQKCRMLRKHLHVQLTAAARVDVKIVSVSGPHDASSAPAGPNEPDQAD